MFKICKLQNFKKSLNISSSQEALIGPFLRDRLETHLHSFLCMELMTPLQLPIFQIILTIMGTLKILKLDHLWPIKIFQRIAAIRFASRRKEKEEFSRTLSNNMVISREIKTQIQNLRLLRH